MTLVEFLLARIAEDEKVATGMQGQRVDCFTPEATDFVERFDFDRVSAECDAKRRIVKRHSSCGSGVGYCDDGGHGWGEEDGPGCGDLADLALPYAGHPDYQPGWQL